MRFELCISRLSMTTRILSNVPNIGLKHSCHLFFDDFCNLTATLAAYIFGVNHDIVYIIGQVLCKLQVVSYIISKRYELWSTNGFKLEVSFHTPSVNSAFHFIARLRRRGSANGTQPNFARQWTVNRTNNLL